jgi:hypothetical protein
MQRHHRFAVTSLLAAPAVADDHAKARLRPAKARPTPSGERGEEQAEAQEKQRRQSRERRPNAHLQHGHAAPLGRRRWRRGRLPAAPSPTVKQQAVRARSSPPPRPRRPRRRRVRRRPRRRPTRSARSGRRRTPRICSAVPGSVARLTGTARLLQAPLTSLRPRRQARRRRHPDLHPTSPLGLPATWPGLHRPADGQAPIAAAAGLRTSRRSPSRSAAGRNRSVSPPARRNRRTSSSGTKDGAIRHQHALFGDVGSCHLQRAAGEVPGRGNGLRSSGRCRLLRGLGREVPGRHAPRHCRADYNDVQPYVQSAWSSPDLRDAPGGIPVSDTGDGWNRFARGPVVLLSSLFVGCGGAGTTSGAVAPNPPFASRWGRKATNTP